MKNIINTSKIKHIFSVPPARPNFAIFPKGIFHDLTAEPIVQISFDP